MAAPLAAVGVAAKVAGKYLAKQAAFKAATKGGRGGGDDDGTNNSFFIILGGIGFLLLMLWALIVGLVQGITSMIPDSPVEPQECISLPHVYYDEDHADYVMDGGSSAGGDGPLASISPGSGQVVEPLERRAGHTTTSGFGPRTPPVPGAYPFHYGLDYSNSEPQNTAILAAADGVVWRTWNDSGSGNVVYIQHNIGGTDYITRYAHLATRHDQYVQAGQSVSAGQQIGVMGNTGTFTTGAHLHFEVWKNGTGIENAIDPAIWLTQYNATSASPGLPGSGYENIRLDNCVEDNFGSGSGAGPWGGHDNGRIPTSAMCPLNPLPNHHVLRCDAANAYNALAAAYQEEFGSAMVITDSYRDYDAQVRCRAEKGNLCATPGTSNHGWGLAIDLGGGIQNFGTPQYQWMMSNAPGYGWINPDWARQNGSKPEPWHWEFTGGGDQSSGADAGKTPESARTMAQGMMSQYGWTGSEFQCLNNLWERESGWDYRAANPTSSARGIAQTMMSAHFGRGWEGSPDAQNFLSSPREQIAWGMDYIDGRYGNPCSAWAHSQQRNWY